MQAQHNTSQMMMKYHIIAINNIIMVKSAVISGGAFASFPGPSYSQLQCSTLVHTLKTSGSLGTRLGGLHSLIIPGNKAVSTAREGLYKVITDLLGLHNCIFSWINSIMDYYMTWHVLCCNVIRLAKKRSHVSMYACGLHVLVAYTTSLATIKIILLIMWLIMLA